MPQGLDWRRITNENGLLEFGKNELNDDTVILD
jgi:hypothetical protein